MKTEQQLTVFHALDEILLKLQDIRILNREDNQTKVDERLEQVKFLVDKLTNQRKEG